VRTQAARYGALRPVVSKGREGFVPDWRAEKILDRSYSECGSSGPPGL